MRKHLLPAALAVVALTTSGEALAREDDQLWTAVSASVKLDPKWQLSQEFVARFSDHRSGLYELEAATMLGYKLGKSIVVAGGYVHNPQYADGDFTVLERRAREQITIENIARIGAGKISARMRLEQRWRDNFDGTAVRARPYLKYSLPLGDQGKTSLNLSNETFINLNTKTFQRTEGIDRMRNLIAVGRKISPKLTVEAGYLNQYGFVRNGDDTMDHVANLSLALSL